MPSPSADAVIIGAGIIGASIAWRLAQSGLRVILLDAGPVGGEASFAGAGMLAPGGELQSRTRWVDLALESLHLYPAFVQELEQITGLRIDYRQVGAVEVAFEEAEWETLRSRGELQRTWGIPSTVLDAAQLRECVPRFEREAAGALFYPEDAALDPHQIMQALRAACGAANVEIREGWRAVAIRTAGASVEIDSAQETLRAAVAVLAAGAWSGEIAVSKDGTPEPLPASFPVKGHLIGFHLEPGALKPFLRHGPTYLLERAGGFTLAGTTMERVGFDRRLDPQIVEDIATRVGELLPSLRGLRPTCAWTGFRPATENLEPEIRRLPGSNLWLAYGHYRNGILLAPATAQLVTGEIMARSRSG